MKKILKNDALMSRKKVKKLVSFVRPCGHGYIIKSVPTTFFKLNLVHSLQRYYMSALRPSLFKKVRHCCLYVSFYGNHKNSYYFIISILQSYITFFSCLYQKYVCFFHQLYRAEFTNARNFLLLLLVEVTTHFSLFFWRISTGCSQ